MRTKDPGRPREFDLDQAVEKAMRVFWARGYEGASMNELTEAMGISKPSLYAAFGDKRGLFAAALERYNKGPRGFGPKAMELPTAKAAVTALLNGVVDVSTRSQGPRGCLQTHGALVCSSESEEIKELIANNRKAGEARLRARLLKAQEAGELSPKTDIVRLTKYIATVANGITVQGASGASRKELKAAVELAMQVWPGQSFPHSNQKKS